VYKFGNKNNLEIKMNDVSHERNKNNAINTWFKEECTVRSLASGICLVGVYQLVIFTLILAINFSMFSPVQWLLNSFGLLFSLQMVVSSIILQAFCFIIVMFRSRHISSQTVRFRRQSDFIYHLLLPKQVSSFVFNLSVSILFGYVFKKFVYHQSSIEADWFIFMMSAFLGLFYSYDFHQSSRNVVTFPIINKRIFRIKSLIWSCLRKTPLNTLKVLQYYYPAYIIIGYLPRFMMGCILGPSISSGSSIITLISTLFDVSLFWICLCIAASSLFMLNITNEMLHLYMTEHYEFPLDGEQSITKALLSENVLVKHLGWYDVNRLSKYDGHTRRFKVFQLNTPGSQAHSWNTICIETLKTIDSMCVALKRGTELKQLNKINSREQLNKINSRVEPATTVNTIGSQPLLSTTDHVLWNRNEKINYTSSALNAHTKMLHDKNEREESNMSLFNNLQMLHWSIEGLCNLVASSLTEDKYGVVQVKLSDILSSLLDLLEICEAYMKVSSTTSQHSYSIDQFNQQQLQQASSLKTLLKNGLYTITTAFGYHISAVRLSNDHQKRLHNFLEMLD